MKDGPSLTGTTIQLKLHVARDLVTYFYSLDEGRTFQQLGSPVPITFSWWKGSRPSLFGYTAGDAAANAFVDFDWARYKNIETTIP